MKIGFFSALLLNHGGGAERYFITFANAMAKKGHRVGIVNLDKSFYRRLSVFLSLYYVCKSTPIPMRYADREIESMLFKSVEWFRGDFRSLKRILQKFEVIYSKNEILDLAVLGLVGFRNIPPVIVGIQTPIHYRITSSLQSKFHNFLYSSFFYRDLLQSSVAVHVCNSDDKGLVEERYPQLRGQVYQIFNPLDTGEFGSTNGKNKGNKHFKILFAGRLTEQKGVDILVKVIQKLSSKPIFGDLCFIMAGSGELEKQVRKIGRRFGNVSYLGHLGHNELLNLYYSTDIMLMPSRWEMFPTVCLQAQMYGLPVIVTDIPGPRDIVIDGKTGFLVKSDPENFVDKIEYLYHLKKENRTKFSQLAIRARQNIIKKFNFNSIFDQLERMLKEKIISG